MSEIYVPTTEFGKEIESLSPKNCRSCIKVNRLIQIADLTAESPNTDEAMSAASEFPSLIGGLPGMPILHKQTESSVRAVQKLDHVSQMMDMEQLSDCPGSSDPSVCMMEGQ